MKLNVVVLCAQIFGTAFHILWSYLLVDYYHYDIKGIGMAGIITNVTVFFILDTYTNSLP